MIVLLVTWQVVVAQDDAGSAVLRLRSPQPFFPAPAA